MAFFWLVGYPKMAEWLYDICGPVIPSIGLRLGLSKRLGLSLSFRSTNKSVVGFLKYIFISPYFVTTNNKNRTPAARRIIYEN